MQSKTASFVEACVNTAFGFTIQVAAQYGLFVFFNVKISTQQFWLFTTAMTVLSVGRGFVIRRLFNSEFWKKWRRKHVSTEIPPNWKPNPGAQSRFMSSEFSNKWWRGRGG